MPQQFDLLINTYLDSKVGVAPRFLTKALSQGLQQNIHQLQKDNLMANANIEALALDNFPAGISG